MVASCVEYNHPDYTYGQPKEAYNKEEINRALYTTPKDDSLRCDFESDDNLNKFEFEERFAKSCFHSNLQY